MYVSLHLFTCVTGLSHIQQIVRIPSALDDDLFIKFHTEGGTLGVSSGDQYKLVGRHDPMIFQADDQFRLVSARMTVRLSIFRRIS